MGFRFQKRIRIFKGLTLNLNKSDSSWRVGRPGARARRCTSGATRSVETLGSRARISFGHTVPILFRFPTARPNYLSNLLAVSH